MPAVLSGISYDNSFMALHAAEHGFARNLHCTCLPEVRSPQEPPEPQTSRAMFGPGPQKAPPSCLAAEVRLCHELLVLALEPCHFALEIALLGCILKL